MITSSLSISKIAMGFLYAIFRHPCVPHLQSNAPAARSLSEAGDMFKPTPEDEEVEKRKVLSEGFWSWGGVLGTKWRREEEKCVVLKPGTLNFVTLLETNISPPKAFWKMISFSQGRICYFLEDCQLWDDCLPAQLSLVDRLWASSCSVFLSTMSNVTSHKEAKKIIYTYT